MSDTQSSNSVTGVTPKKARNILSERVSYTNSEGQTIVGYFDHFYQWQGQPFIIISPGFGETKKDYISLAYYLVSNGFNVLRYDATCHLGESDGDIVDADLLRMIRDLSTSIDYVQSTFSQDRVGIVAVSLSGRIALRVASFDSRISFLSILVGLIDMRGAFKAIYQEDIFEQYMKGRYSATLDVFGHEVRTSFIKNAIEKNLAEFPGTLADVQQIKCPIALMAAENDVWTNLSDTRRLLEVARNPGSELHVISGALHQLQENPRLAKLAIEQVVRSCTKHLVGNSSEVAKVVIQPNLHDIVVQNKTELEHLKRLSTIIRADEKDFWEDYLSKFSIALKLPDYKDLLQSAEQLLNCAKNGGRVLDAGCGNGHFGVWLLKRLGEKFELSETPIQDIHYIGLDFAERAVGEARRRHGEILAHLDKRAQHKDVPNSKNYKFEYVVGSLDKDLPFPDEFFDKICCNLVISYLEYPSNAMKELTRVLKKKGQLVVSSLKPYCDLSLVYRNFTLSAPNKVEQEEAIELLSNTGKIRRKETEGYYQFYTEQELEELVSGAGLTPLSLLRGCGDQVNIAFCEKPG